jgi:hypothetical protein
VSRRLSRSGRDKRKKKKKEGREINTNRAKVERQAKDGSKRVTSAPIPQGTCMI